MFELLNEPGYTSAQEAQWQDDFQVLIDVLRTYAPSNVLIVPGLGSSQNFFPPSGNPFPTGSNVAFGVHGYLNPTDFQNQNFCNVYGRVAQIAPLVMTEVKGLCPSDWTSGPADFTAMLEYNYSTNIGVTAWTFDDLGDEGLVAITKLGSPDLYTDAWTWAATNCTTATHDWKPPPSNTVYGSGDRYSNWMLSLPFP